MSLRPGTMQVPADEWAGYLEWRGRAPHPSGGKDRILYLKGVALQPDWRYEWHPQERRVYLVRMGRTVDAGNGLKAERAEPIAFNIETYGQAWNAVLIYQRGVREGRTPSLAAPPQSTTLVGV